MKSLNLLAMVLPGGVFLGAPCFSAWAVIVLACKVMGWAISTKGVYSSPFVNVVGLIDISLPSPGA